MRNLDYYIIILWARIGIALVVLKGLRLFDMNVSIEKKKEYLHMNSLLKDVFISSNFIRHVTVIFVRAYKDN